MRNPFHHRRGHVQAGIGVAVAVAAILLALAAPQIGIGAPSGKPAAATAAIAPVISYQGRLLNPTTGAPLNGSYTFVFRLYNVASDGAALWTETKDLTASNGLFSTLLGDTTALPTAIFTGQDLWLGIKVGADAEATPRQRIGAVAYALYGDNADRLDGQDSTAFAAASHGHDAAYLKKAGPDSMSGNSNAAAILSVTQAGSQHGILATTSSVDPGEAALYGRAGATAGPTINGVAGVFGTSSGARGVIGSSSTSDGMLGFSTSSTGVNGQSIDGYGVRAFSQNGVSLRVEGDAEVSSDLAVSGRINNAMAPIALGFINTNGSVSVSAGSFTSSWVAGSSWYEITISGYSYLLNTYVTVVTPTCSGYTARTDSVSGKLLVQIHNSASVASQCAFQFVTYKP